MRSKMLLRIFILPLVINLILKPTNIVFSFASLNIPTEEFGKTLGLTFSAGTAAPLLCAGPAVAMSVSDSIKEGSKSIREFLKILKRNSNTSLRGFKWFTAILAAPWAASVIYKAASVIYKFPKYKDIREDDGFRESAVVFSIPSGACLASYIGQKLTEDKEKTQKNDEPKIVNSHEKEIAK